MGNFGSGERNVNEIIVEIEEKYKKLHNESKQEQLTELKRELDNKYNEIILNYKKTTDLVIDNLKSENDELKKQINSLKNINTSATTKPKNENISNLNVKSDNEELKKISRERINEFVEKILNDSEMNISYIPDFVERQIYKNVFDLLLRLMEHTIDTTSVNFIGHKLTLRLEAENKIENNNVINNDDSNIKNLD